MTLSVEEKGVEGTLDQDQEAGWGKEECLSAEVDESAAERPFMLCRSEAGRPGGPASQMWKGRNLAVALCFSKKVSSLFVSPRPPPPLAPPNTKAPPAGD